MRHPLILVAVASFGTLSVPAGSEAAPCYADPERLSQAIAVVVASFRCPGFAEALTGERYTVFIRSLGVLDQSTGPCTREIAIATDLHQTAYLVRRDGFCGEVAAIITGDRAMQAAAETSGGLAAPTPQE